MQKNYNNKIKFQTAQPYHEIFSLYFSSVFSANTDTHKQTHTYAPEAVYGIFCLEFLHCKCQTVNPGKEISTNLVKLIHKFHLRSLLIVQKGTFNVLIAQLIEFQTKI